MKRIRLLLAFAVAFTIFPTWVNATKVYTINERFDTNVDASDANWGFNAVSGHAFTYDATNQVFQVRTGAPSSFSTKTFATAVTQGTDNKITVELILRLYTNGVSNGAVSFYFRDSNKKAIFGLGINRGGSPGKYRLGRVSTYPGEVVPSAIPTNSNNVIDIDQPTAKVTVVLDMSAKTLSYDALVGTFNYTSRAFTATTGSASATGIAFIDGTAGTDLASILTNYYRPTSTSGIIGYDLMYVGIATEQTVATADVAVQFKDQDNNIFKTTETASAQVVGTTYSATSLQKTSVLVGSNYYVLDPTSPSSVVVDVAGSTLNLLFRRTTYFSTMTWNGSVGTNTDKWSEWYQNFINDITATAYQKDASTTFDATAANKAVIVNDILNLGTGSINVNSTGYSFTGSGTLNGSGSLNINLSGADALSFGVTNNLTGRTQITGGQVTVSKSGALGTNVDINGVTTLIPSVALPATVFNASTQITPTAASSIAGLASGTGVKVSISSAIATANAVSAFTINPSGTFTGELEMNGTAVDQTRFAMTSASSTYLESAKVSLKGTAFLFIDTNQGAATTINIGTLSGEAGTRLGWGKSSDLARTITWSVGALNESSEYAGTITNLGGYNTGGAFYTGSFTNFIKVGNGTLTFSGTANTHFGSFTVNGGELNVTGSICKSTISSPLSVVTVGASGKLSGNGTIGGTTTVNGTLAGNLNFAEGLVLAGTTKINVTGFDAGQFDVIDVVGAVTLGGTLDINVTALTPTVGTTIKIINAGSYAGAFTTFKCATGYSFDAATGYLTYSGVTQWTGTGNWNTPANWMGGLTPATPVNVVVASGNLTINENVIVNDLTISGAARVTLNNGSTLTINGNLAINSSAVEPGTFVDFNAAGGLTVTGTTTVKLFLVGVGDVTPTGRFWYISSPVTGANSGAVAASGNNKLWSYSENSNSYTEITDDVTTLNVGQGYVARMGASANASFVGALNTGDKSIDITRNVSGNTYRGYNLIGNPYPSYATLVAGDNTNIEPTTWFRTELSTLGSMAFDTYNISTSEYVSGSGNGAVTGFIPPMQAFWVKTFTAGTTSVTFKQANRSHQTGAKLRSAEVDTVPSIRLEISNGKCKDQTLIGLHTNANDGFDRFDSHKMTNNVDSFPEIYTMIGNEELAINGLKHDGRTKTLALGFRTGKRGDFRLRVLEMKNLGDSARVILKDKIKNCEKVLTDSTVYDFTSEVATTTDRFSIVIISNAPTSLKTLNTASADAFSTNDNQIQVRLIGTSNNNAAINIYNTVGQQMGSFTTNSANSVLNKRFAPGIYMVNISAEGVQVTKKVVIN